MYVCGVPVSYFLNFSRVVGVGVLSGVRVVVGEDFALFSSYLRSLEHVTSHKHTLLKAWVKIWSRIFIPHTLNGYK